MAKVTHPYWGTVEIADEDLDAFVGYGYSEVAEKPSPTLPKTNVEPKKRQPRGAKGNG